MTHTHINTHIALEAHIQTHIALEAHIQAHILLESHGDGQKRINNTNKTRIYNLY